jgi:hypothetical protein
MRSIVATDSSTERMNPYRVGVATDSSTERA